MDIIVISDGDEDDVVPLSQTFKFKGNKPLVQHGRDAPIDISSSDSEDVKIIDAPTIQLKRSRTPIRPFASKRRRVCTEPPREADSDSDLDAHQSLKSRLDAELGDIVKSEVYVERHKRQILHQQGSMARETTNSLFFTIITSLRPFLQSHQALSHRQRKFELKPSRLDLRNPRFTEQSGLYRLGGCPNSITQAGGCVVITSNTHGATAALTTAPPDNWNGLTAFSAANGARIPFMTAGHAVRRPPTNRDQQPRDDDGPINEHDYIFKNVLDAQFDPARPDTFLTVGSDKLMFTWTIENEDDGNWKIKAQENVTETLSQPHYIQFNPNQRHWTRTEEALSMYAVTAGSGKLLVEYPNDTNCFCTVEKDEKQEIASFCWGIGPTQDMIFAGTESTNTDDNSRSIGRQLGFRVHNSHGVVERVYTKSQEEAQCLTLNPQGNLLASFTRTCDTSSSTCPRCDTRQIFSSHKLSLYSATADSGRVARQHNPNLIAETVLPEFRPSDRIREAGIVVQASWSPCGVYIACGTDDDRVYIYDHRFIGAKPLLTFKHAPSTSIGSKPGNTSVRRATTFDNKVSECCSVEEKRPEYGVTALTWLSSRFDGRGLVSGGSDGCVRLWDVRHGQPESIILAQMETSISCLSLGDSSKGDIPLVVADNHGLVKMFGVQESFNGEN